jgi:hypothetical protein
MALAGVMLSAGCGSGGGDGPKGIDNTRLERELTALMKRQTGTVVDQMACPSPVGRAGLTIECNGAFDGEPDIVIVTLLAADPARGRFRARLKNLLGGRLESAIGRELRRRGVAVTSVLCPTPVAQRRGVSFQCEIETRDGARGRVRVTQTDDGGNVRIARVP